MYGPANERVSDAVIVTSLGHQVRIINYALYYL
jgi:hypothetical protein